MFNRTLTAATLFALLITVPARAATVDLIFDVNFGGGYTASGNLSFVHVGAPPGEPFSYFLPRLIAACAIHHPRR
jgi:hypothetical protein